MIPSLVSLRAHWFVACASAELGRRPLGRRVLGLPIVLFRSEGAAAALVDRCPHRNAALSEGRLVGATIECSYHGWRFDGAGVCRLVPGLTGESGPRGHRARAVGVAERDGLVWVHLGDDERARPPLPAPRHPRFDDPGFDSFLWPTDAQCGLVDGLENLLDGSHPHFVHAGLVRVSHRRRPTRVTVRRDGEKAEAVYEENRVPAGVIPRLVEGRRTASIGRFFPPATAQLEYRGAKGPRFVLTSMFTPSDEDHVRIHSVVSTPRGWAPAFLKQWALRALFGRVLRQDREVLRRQQANMARFGGEDFTSTPVDVLRPHILHLLGSDEGERGSGYEHTLILDL